VPPYAPAAICRGAILPLPRFRQPASSAAGQRRLPKRDLPNSQRCASRAFQITQGERHARHASLFDTSRAFIFRAEAESARGKRRNTPERELSGCAPARTAKPAI